MARKSTTLVETLGGARVLTEAEVKNNYMIAFDPGGSTRTVDLPAATTLAGQEFFIINAADAGSEDLTVRLTGGGATVATVTQNEICHLICWSATASAPTPWLGSVSKAT